MKELDEIDQLFQATFEAFEQTPDPSVKENIDRAIASKKRRKRFLFILFPILLCIGIIDGFNYFRPLSDEISSREPGLSQNYSSKQHTKQSSEKETSRKRISESRSKSTRLPHGPTDSSGKGMSYTPDQHSKKENLATDHKNAITYPGKKTGFDHQNPDEANKEFPQAHTNAAQTESKAHPSKTNLADSTIAEKDSVHKQELATTPPSVSEAPDPAIKKSNSWSLSILTGWESEQKRPSEQFDTTNFSGPREFAQIHGTSFYGKIELNRNINSRLDLILGLGFRAYQAKQYGSLYSLDSFYDYEGVSSTTPPDSVVYYIRHQAGSQVFRTYSLTLPLGLAYSVPITQRFNFRLAGGTEIAYSWSTGKQIQSPFSRPVFRPFGLNLWLRPEIHYSFGKYQLFGFGSFNQALYQHLKWDFAVRRNPAFGAGIGLRIEL